MNKIFSPCPQVNVGIGTSEPLFKLEVIGNTHISGTIGIGTTPHADVQVNAQTLKQVGYCVNHQYNGDFGYAFKAIVNNDNTKGIGIYSELYGKDMFTVYGDGRIEVSNAAGKILQLDADGLMHTREIRVDALAWPDYVFEADYKLKPLSELKEYITTKKHLPNIPSEREIKENGINVSQMQQLQMEKIEELTLYMIQMDEKMNQMQTKIDALEKENATLKTK